MASVNFMKLHGAAEVSAQMRHSLTDERLKHRHSNPDIDTSLTALNRQWGGDYHTMLEAYQDRILELDAFTNRNQRKDRVTAFALETAVPEGLSTEQEDLWCDDVIEHLRKRFGENFIGAVEHKDERHNYTDKGGVVKQSRVHIHAYVVPEIDGKLNGKSFSSRSAMKQLNREIEKMTLSRYGVRYMTGESPEHLSVERLKVRSAEQERHQVDEKLNDLKNKYIQSAKKYNALVDEAHELQKGNTAEAQKIVNRTRERSR